MIMDCSDAHDLWPLLPVLRRMFLGRPDLWTYCQAVSRAEAGVHFRLLLEGRYILKWLFSFIVLMIMVYSLPLCSPYDNFAKNAACPKCCSPFNHVLFGVTILPFVWEVCSGPIFYFQPFYEDSHNHTQFSSLKQSVRIQIFWLIFFFFHLCVWFAMIEQLV